MHPPPGPAESPLRSVPSPPSPVPAPPAVPPPPAGMRLPVVLAAAVTTAVLLFYGTGLTPLPWLTWLAPLPVLLLAPRVSAPVAAVAAFGAWGAGGLNLWSLQRDRLAVPLPVALLSVVLPALLAVAAVLLFRVLLGRGRPVAAAVSVPAVWVSGEYLVSVLGPDGALWSLAYTQADVLPVLQLASLTGVWGITFTLTAVPAAVAAILAPGTGGRARLGVGLTTLVLLAAVVAYGTVRLAAPAGPNRNVALLAAGQHGDWAPVDTPKGAGKLRDMLARLRALPPETDVAVLAEGVFVTEAADLPKITGPLGALARERRTDIVAGVIVTDTGHNTAMLFPAGGGGPQVYRKRHMVPGVEPYEPGERALVLGDTGVAICKDLDFPALARENRQSGATVMLVPSWDFGLDAWQHSRIAVTRGVENGFAVVRGAADGNLTVSDPYGRVLAERAAGGRAVVSVTAAVPVGGAGTPYTGWGDWFAWSCLAGAAALAGWALRGGRDRPRTGPALRGASPETA
ncbi:nitrilase-related carbon-nitrogen hydrolase [Planobispora siamensis]|uniref:Apolipoprotein N-acyltransferase n=1 Tax=Planobispora siamensis TaxID=936338 RepID=A0A8J3SQL2_9ACTN|nr:nitrilase-related carbon-nitrogen hydrolase [Planobispora siamensis]GIH96910.1 apolipoprotein N-acyltransferase [Planobispora siamensis]